MTPEHARELLDGRTPSPWWWCETDYPEVTVYHEKYGIIAKSVDIEEADLICTAPDLAELVAGMHYEYAVQVGDEDGDWVGIDDKGLPTYDYGKITWHKSRRAAMQSLNDLPFPAMQSRIVRRLVTDEEVVG